METGDRNISGTSFSNHKASLSSLDGQHLVVHLAYDGMAILAATADKKVEALGTTNWLAGKEPLYLLDEAEKFLTEHHIDLSKASGIHWLLSFSSVTLIPDVLHQKGTGREVLQHTSRITDKDVVYSDFWSRRDVVATYAVPTAIANWIKQKNEHCSIAHNSHAINDLANKLLADSPKPFCLLYVSPSFAELYIAGEEKVIFYNQFPHDVPQDLLYYVLLVLEQNRLLAPEITLFMAGHTTKGDDLYRLLTTYIGEVKEVALASDIKHTPGITKKQLREHINLFSSL